MTIQFVAPQPDGARTLGLGLSFANLDLIEADDPVVIRLGDHGGEGTLLVAHAKDDEGVAGARQLFGDPCHVLRLDDEAIASARRGELLERPLGASGFAGALLFACSDELAMVEAMRQAGLLSSDAPIGGLEEYLLHVANRCPGCPQCEARAAVGGGPDDGGMHGGGTYGADLHAQQGWRGSCTQEQHALWARLFSSANIAVAAVVGLMVIAAAVMAFFAHRAKQEQARELEAERAARRRLVQKQAASNGLRRERLSKERAALLTPTLSGARCPVALRAPRAMRTRMLMKLHHPLKEGGSRFESLARWALADAAVDILPADVEGVGPLRRRLHRDGVLETRPYPIEPAVHRMFVVSGWRDPVLPLDIDKTLREAPEGTKARFTTGLVRGRLLIWSYEANRVICASDEVEIRTPPLTLIRRSDFIKPGEKLIDDALNKARVETVIAALRAATERLRSVAKGS